MMLIGSDIKPNQSKINRLGSPYVTGTYVVILLGFGISRRIAGPVRRSPAIEQNFAGLRRTCLKWSRDVSVTTILQAQNEII
jgi:hypothetical protein